MPIYKAPVEDVTFLLNDVFQIDRYDNLPGFTDASADVREAILGEAAKLSEEVLQPLNRTGDLEGCKRHDDASVTTPKGFKEAFKQVAEGGWLGLSAYVRAEFLKNRTLDYVRAARALGQSDARIMWHHILPNSLTPVVTFAPFEMVAAIGALDERRRTVARLQRLGATVIDAPPRALPLELADAYLRVKATGRL